MAFLNRADLAYGCADRLLRWYVGASQARYGDGGASSDVGGLAAALGASHRCAVEEAGAALSDEQLPPAAWLRFALDEWDSRAMAAAEAECSLWLEAAPVEFAFDAARIRRRARLCRATVNFRSAPAWGLLPSAKWLCAVQGEIRRELAAGLIDTELPSYLKTFLPADEEVEAFPHWWAAHVRSAVREAAETQRSFDARAQGGEWFW